MIYNILIYIFVFLVVIGFIIYLIGRFLPVAHTVSLSRVFPSSPEIIYRKIKSFQDYPLWRPDLKLIQPVDSISWKETDSHKNVMTYSFVRDEKNRLIESKIMDEDKPFGGSWTFELKIVPDGTELTITENGRVFSPVFRFVSKYIFGHTATIKAYISYMEKELKRSGKKK
ncbi:LIC10604 family protein [Leptospira ilyithenensis]|uniref:SRPBCC family protein n=1 Tax=Leptospira ilyithenensis TaxID=2484901 RepID=A0A4R9LQ59_9LEPT|nr:SRPBCC family protein [Leptospira ilyithenensis]TGN10347.1 SRPBCC family protein [Leptospira ilyithenensis]